MVMDKRICQSSGESAFSNITATAGGSSSSNSNNSNGGSNNKKEEDLPPQQEYLKHLNRLSHKICKPPVRKPSSFDPHHRPLLLEEAQQSLQSNPPTPPPQHQPPVYNINKNDFRNVVQKLTGSPAHDRIPAPSPINLSKPQSSRLQRIRPPPLAHLTNRPTPLLDCPALPQNPGAAVPAVSLFPGQRPGQPLSPLPPLPSVHTAVESPISAYMRYLKSSSSSSSAIDSDQKRLLSELSPLAQQSAGVPSPTTASGLPLNIQAVSLPLPFGCLPSPKSPYPLLSSNSMFSSSSANQFGFQQFPLSPTLQVPSPKWKGM